MRGRSTLGHGMAGAGRDGKVRHAVGPRPSRASVQCPGGARHSRPATAREVVVPAESLHHVTSGQVTSASKPPPGLTAVPAPAAPVPVPVLALVLPGSTVPRSSANDRAPSVPAIVVPVATAAASASAGTVAPPAPVPLGARCKRAWTSASGIRIWSSPSRPYRRTRAVNRAVQCVSDSKAT